MNILVTGAGGFLGRHLLEIVRREGAVVHTVGVSRRGGEAHHVLEHVEDSAGIGRALEASDPHIVFHLAGSADASDQELMRRVNVGFASALVGALRRRGKRCSLVAVGSAAEYGAVREDDLPVTEGHEGRSTSPYALTKLEQTRLVLGGHGAGLETMVARCFNLIGPAMPSAMLLPSLARRLSAGGEVHVACAECTRDFIDVRDAAELLWRLARVRNFRGVVNICTGQETTVLDFARMIRRVLGVETVLKPGPTPECGAVVRSVGSTRKLFSAVGPYTFTGLEQSVTHALAQGMAR